MHGLGYRCGLKMEGRSSESRGLRWANPPQENSSRTLELTCGVTLRGKRIGCTGLCAAASLQRVTGLVGQNFLHDQFAIVG